MRLRVLSATIATAMAALAASSCLPVMAAPHASAAQMVTTQLPRTVRPTHYAVELEPNAAAATFKGKVSIAIDVLTPTATITLNAADLAFSAAQLRPAKGGAMQTATIHVDAKEQTASFGFGKPLPKGQYELVLDYTGTIGTQPAGLFLLDYDSEAGKKRALYTQFENSDARRMIPSWDEPNYKASFDLTVTAPADQMAVSNMPAAASSTLADGRKVTRFARTPKMSTYLLFFGLGEFERATAMQDGTEIGVITRKGSLDKARFALEASTTLLHEFNDYFGVPYPLPKLDNIAAPGRSQSFSAMENWGTVFTFEYAMLLDPAVSTQGDKEQVFATAAHEMAHQWFGDLVTMHWWDDLWLNEGFASWMESRMTARLHPEWQTAVNAVNAREGGMAADAMATSHPVVQHVSTVEQASQAFDGITYSKGEAVIRMLENYVGETAWREGVRAYMRKHAYGNTSTEDLWRQIEKAAHQPVTAIARDFTLQAGVPMIKVDAVSCEGGTSVVSLSQGQFSRGSVVKKPLSWRVPVVLQRVGTTTEARALVTGGKATVRLDGCGPVVVNAGQAGYFRTVYAAPAFAALAAQFGKLGTVDQYGILEDAWSLALEGQQSMQGYLDLVNATPVDAAPPVWGSVAGTFGAIHHFYDGDTARQQRFDKYASERLAPVMARIGWDARDGEATATAKLRGQMIGILGELGDAGTIAEARRRYAARDTDPAAMPAVLRRVILYVVASNADATTWDALHAAAKAERSPMIKDGMYDLLAASKDAALARRALDLALTDEPGATSAAGMIDTVSGVFPEMAFDFAVANLAKVSERVDGFARSRYFPGLAASSADPAMVAKVKAYAEANLAPASRHDAEIAVARIQYRIKVRGERLPDIDAWLSRNKVQ